MLYLKKASDTNSLDNYLTRICTGGMINTRKIELVHMLLKDIHMFHEHACKNRNEPKTLSQYSISRKSSKNCKIHLFLNSKIMKISIFRYFNFDWWSILNFKIFTLLKKSKFLNIETFKIFKFQKNVKVNTLFFEKIPKNNFKIHYFYQGTQKLNSTFKIFGEENLLKSSNGIKMDKKESELNSMYTNPSGAYMPIRTEMTSKIDTRHTINYLQLDDPNLDYHNLQILENGVTFVVFLNESELVQSNCLLNIRLEADNCTLVWSKPAWDASSTSNATSLASTSANFSSNSGVLLLSPSSASKSNLSMRGSIVNNPLFLSLEASASSLNSKSDNFLKRKQSTKHMKGIGSLDHNLLTTPKHNNSAKEPLQNSGNETGESLNDQSQNYCISSLTKHYVHHEFVALDPYEGFLDLNFVKHVKLGCMDEGVFKSIQNVSKKYSVTNIDQQNVISIVYGSNFSENK